MSSKLKSFSGIHVNTFPKKLAIFILFEELFKSFFIKRRLKISFIKGF